MGKAFVCVYLLNSKKEVIKMAWGNEENKNSGKKTANGWSACFDVLPKGNEIEEEVGFKEKDDKENDLAKKSLVE